MASHYPEGLNGDENHHQSGDTSPTHAPTVSTNVLRGRDSQETLVSSSDTESNPSIVYPGAPVNSPTTQSLAGDLGAMNLEYADQQLGEMQVGPTPPNTVTGPVEQEGKAHLRARVRGDVPLLQQLFKRPAPKRKGKRVTKRAIVRTEPTEIEHIHEGSTWVGLAKEDVARGLQRMVMAAKDMHKIDESIPIEQYYNQILAEVLKEAEIVFDPIYMQ